MEKGIVISTMNLHLLLLASMLFLISACKDSPDPSIIFDSKELVIKKISEQAYLHISYLPTKNFGKVACNGLVFIDNNEAIVLDCPVQNEVSKTLIDFVENDLSSKIKGVVVNHFHEDCLGGLATFHKKGIPSYANELTISLAAKDSSNTPLRGFNGKLQIPIGQTKVINHYLGEGHTKDNIVSYIPAEEILFGGCMIKSMNAGKGNLEDANVSQWSNTVKKVAATYPNAKIVVPGHGKTGGRELLDFTISLFRKKETNLK